LHMSVWNIGRSWCCCTLGSVYSPGLCSFIHCAIPAPSYTLFDDGSCSDPWQSSSLPSLPLSLPTSVFCNPLCRTATSFCGTTNLFLTQIWSPLIIHTARWGGPALSIPQIQFTGKP
jgi:hypothetical protein